MFILRRTLAAFGRNSAGQIAQFEVGAGRARLGLGRSSHSAATKRDLQDPLLNQSWPEKRNVVQICALSSQFRTTFLLVKFPNPPGAPKPCRSAHAWGEPNAHDASGPVDEVAR